MRISSLLFRVLAARHVAPAILCATLVLAGGASIVLARPAHGATPNLCATPTPWDAMPSTLNYLYCPNN